jgi:hypothetical protein
VGDVLLVGEAVRARSGAVSGAQRADGKAACKEICVGHEITRVPTAPRLFPLVARSVNAAMSAQAPLTEGQRKLGGDGETTALDPGCVTQPRPTRDIGREIFQALGASAA